MVHNYVIMEELSNLLSQMKKELFENIANEVKSTLYDPYDGQKPIDKLYAELVKTRTQTVDDLVTGLTEKTSNLDTDGIPAPNGNANLPPTPVLHETLSIIKKDIKKGIAN